MTEIVLVRQNREPIAKADAEAARKVLFGQVDGLSEAHKKSWRRLWSWFLKRAEPGEMVEIKTHRERLGWFHRKHMALEQAIFDSQERFEHFEQLRLWMKVGAGFVEWLPGPKGGVIPIPKSIAYSALEQDAMELVHDDIVAFLRTEHAQRTLWRHLTPAARADMVETVLASFEREP